VRPDKENKLTNGPETPGKGEPLKSRRTSIAVFVPPTKTSLARQQLHHSASQAVPVPASPVREDSTKEGAVEDVFSAPSSATSSPSDTQPAKKVVKRVAKRSNNKVPLRSAAVINKQASLIESETKGKE